MATERPTLDEFVDIMCQDSKFKLYPHQREMIKMVSMLDEGKITIDLMGRRFGKNYLMEKARHLKFWGIIVSLVDHFSSSHPWDKSIVQELEKGGMTLDEIKQFRELTLKAAKAYYQGNKSDS